MKPRAAFKALFKRALAYPGTFEDRPWGHTVVKCSNKKIFAFFDDEGGALGFTVKLPHSQDAVLTLFSWAEPTGYGLGEKGWVSARFARGADVPYPMLLEWLDESFRAVAPKRDQKLLS